MSIFKTAMTEYYMQRGMGKSIFKAMNAAIKVAYRGEDDSKRQEQGNMPTVQEQHEKKQD